MSTTRKQTGVVIGLIAAAIVIAVVVGTHTATSSTPAASTSTAKAVTVTYEVTGTAPAADVTYQTPSGTTQQQGVAVPMGSKATGRQGLEVHGFEAGDSVYISAQNTGGGSVVCSILEGGRVIASNTAAGEFAIATCSASA